MSQETIWVLEIDGSPAVSSLEEIDAALQGISDGIAAVVASSADLSGLDDAITGVSTVAADAQSQIDGLTEAMAQMSSTIAEDTSIIDGLNESIANLEAQIAALTGEFDTAEAGAGGLAAALGALGDVATGVGEALDAAQGPLIMLSAGAIMVGGSFLKMGMQGQDGIALVQGMAGASNQDIQNLEQSAMQLGETMDQASQGLYQVGSAGYTGSQGIEVLDNATKAAKASQSQLGDVSSALTSVLHAYNLSADDSGKVTDEMVQTVVAGKQSFSDFASAIGPLAATAGNLGISFDQVTAAEATMTQINPHVKQDAVELQHLMTALASDVDKTATTAQGLGIKFDEAHYKTLDLQGKLQYLKDQCGDNQTAFTKLVGGTSGLAAALDLLSGKGTVYQGNLKSIENSQGATDKAFERSQQTISASMDRAGAAMSVFATRVTDALGPKITPLIDGVATTIGHMADFVTQHVDIMMPILAGLATFFGVILVAAIAAFLAPLIAAAAPFLLVAAAIGLVVAGIVLLVQHWNQITQAMGQNPAIKEAQKIFQDIGAFLQSTFAPIVAQFATTWKTQLLPAFQGFAPVVEPLKMLLGAVAMIVGVVLVVALALLTGALKGIAQAAAATVAGFIQAFGGLVQGMMGFVKIISGLLAFLVDLFTGNWSKIGADLGVAWQGILTMASGFGNVFMGIFGGLFSAAWGLLSGFITGIIDFFIHLWDELVGHSIVPDMINGIVDWFEQLPGRVGAAVEQLITSTISFFENLASQAQNDAGQLVAGVVNWFGQLPGRAESTLSGVVGAVSSALSAAASAAIQGGANIVNGIADGIRGAIGAVGSAIGAVTDFISAHLPHSPAKEGALKDLLYQGGQITEQVSEGMLSNLPKLQTAIKQITQPISVGLAPSSLTAPSNLTASTGIGGAGSQDSAMILNVLTQILTAIQRQQGGQGNLTMNNTIAPGTQSAQLLYQLIQSLSGANYESVQRGGY